MIKALGCIFLVLSGSLTGVFLAKEIRRTELLFKKLEYVFRLMRDEIEFHFTPMQELCKAVSKDCGHRQLSEIFSVTAEQLQVFPGTTVGQAMQNACKVCKLKTHAASLLCEIFSALGKQDVYAQVRVLQYAEKRAGQALAEIRKEEHQRMRSYRILGICTGVAAAIVLI